MPPTQQATVHSDEHQPFEPSGKPILPPTGSVLDPTANQSCHLPDHKQITSGHEINHM